MKRYEFMLDDLDLKSFFPPYRLKKKAHIINILLEASRFVLVRDYSNSIKAENKLLLYIDKMSRLFFFKEGKYYSIFFPFNLVEENGKLSLNYKNFMEIDSLCISNLITVLNDERFDSNSSFDFADPIYNLEDTYSENFWILFRDLMLLESGYLRYDFDPDSYAEAKAKGSEHLHPENHVDIFYRGATSIKLGLVNKIIADDFLDLIDSKSDCLYLKKH